MSSRLVGVLGLDVDGEPYANNRRRVGVAGSAPIPEPEATGLVGDIGLRGEGGVTSACNIELKMEFACSGWQISTKLQQ